MSVALAEYLRLVDLARQLHGQWIQLSSFLIHLTLQLVSDWWDDAALLYRWRRVRDSRCLCSDFTYRFVPDTSLTSARSMATHLANNSILLTLANNSLSLGWCSTFGMLASLLLVRWVVDALLFLWSMRFLIAFGMLVRVLCINL